MSGTTKGFVVGFIWSALVVILAGIFSMVIAPVYHFEGDVIGISVAAALGGLLGGAAGWFLADMR